MVESLESELSIHFISVNISKNRKSVCLLFIWVIMSSGNVMKTETDRRVDRKDHTVGVSHGLNMWHFPSFGIWPCANIWNKHFWVRLLLSGGERIQEVPFWAQKSFKWRLKWRPWFAFIHHSGSNTYNSAGLLIYDGCLEQRYEIWDMNDGWLTAEWWSSPIPCSS